MIIVNNISKTFINKILFEDISFKISNNQKVGFVGPNGVGKTTLLKIILGEEEPDTGSVIATGETIGYLAQKLEYKKNEIIYDYLIKKIKYDYDEYKIDSMIKRSGLKEFGKDAKISNLSGGQKMKLGLAGILLMDPTTLLLDEPTNNLDLKSIVWLESFVKNFQGKVLVISHDRCFLDNCANKIIELDLYTKDINEYGGNFSDYILEKKRRRENRETEFRIQEKKEKKMKAWIADKKQQLTYHQSPKVAKQLQAMKKRLEREVENRRIDKPRDYKSFKVATLANYHHKKKSIITIKNYEIPNLFYCQELYIYGQDRIHLQGLNGSGKTSLIKSIVGLFKKYTGDIEIAENIKLGYFTQEHEILNDNNTIIDTLSNKTGINSEARLRNILGGFLFTKQRIIARTSTISEGEKARLIIAILIHQKNDFLILDEPTNHLDLESREVLAEALINYQGGFILVSHDRYFVRQIGISRVIRIKDQFVEEE